MTFGDAVRQWRRAVSLALIMVGTAAAVERPKEANVITVGEPSMADDAFARALLGQLGQTRGNVVASPASIEACVLLALAGARGQTADQIATALHVDAAERANLAALIARTRAPFQAAKGRKTGTATMANSVWVQKKFPVKDDYRKLLETSADAGFEQLDFVANTDAARRTINAWVDAHTQHKIPELFGTGSINPSSRLVLANAVYFKADWSKPFDKQWTKNQPFHRPGQSDITVPLMHKKSEFRYYEAPTYQIVELPYAGDSYSMVIWLPQKAEELAALEAEVLKLSTVEALRELQMTDVDLYVPRFKLNSSLSLVDTLKAMGMVDAFTDAANFSGISSQSLMISAIVHQAVVEVDEVGTEAAAATGAVFAPTAALPREDEPKIFRADHPFVFAIRARETGDILFMGRLETPGK